MDPCLSYLCPFLDLPYWFFHVGKHTNRFWQAWDLCIDKEALMILENKWYLWRDNDK